MKYKYEYNCYAPYQYEDLQDHLEQMAVRGWILERMDYHFLVYRRGGTQLTRYALAYHPEVGDMDHPRAPRLEDYAYLCSQAGWELVGIGSLESAIEDAYLKTMTGYTEYSAAVSGFSTQSAAIRQARNQVREAYAQETATELQSIIGDQTLGIPAAVVEQLKSSVTSHSKASIYGQLKEAYTISRKVGNEYEVRSFYLLSDDDKFIAQLTALRQSIAITKLNQEVLHCIQFRFLLAVSAAFIYICNPSAPDIRIVNPSRKRLIR